MNDILDVYLNSKLVGYLHKRGAKLSFQYAETYLAEKNVAPLSISMPIQAAAFDNETSEAFFSGLLPESHARIQIARILRISEDNTFSLLEKIGGDCAGAISLFPHGSSQSNIKKPEYRILTDEDAFKILNQLSARPLGIGEANFRISGAGAQDKLMASVIDRQIALPLNGTPSTHIIKTPITGLTDSVQNEFFCMTLAKFCGFNVPQVKTKRIKDVLFYIIDRYDRVEIEPGCFKRLHQEDFCQALNIAPKNKYEAEGGPGILKCYELMNDIGLSGADKIAFTDILIFNYLIGNGDAHAKNFSILYTDQGPALAPFYDLLSTEVYHHSSKHRMAMKLGGKNYLSYHVSLRNFLKLAESIGYKDNFMAARVKRLCEAADKNADYLIHLLKNPVNAHLHSPIQDKIVAAVKRNAGHLIESL